MWYISKATENRKGSLLPLDVKKSDSSFAVKSLGMDKQLAHNKQLRDCGDFECVLLYPDLDLVNNIQRTSDPFTVEGYREAIGSPYNRVNLYLCKLDDFESKGSLLNKYSRYCKLLQYSLWCQEHTVIQSIS